MKNILFITMILLVCAAWSRKIFTEIPAHKKNAADPHSFYLSTIKPLMETKCAPCHIPEKGGFKASFENFDSASKYLNEMIVRVELDSMDPKYMPFRRKRAALTASDISTLKAWRDSIAGK